MSDFKVNDWIRVHMLERIRIRIRGIRIRDICLQISQKGQNTSASFSIVYEDDCSVSP